MSVQSHSFQQRFEMAENTEKIYLVASSVKAQEGAPNTASKISAFHTETSLDYQFRDEEKQKTVEIRSQILPVQGSGAEEMDRLSASDRECRSRSVSIAPRSSSRSSCTSASSCSFGSTRRVARHVARRDRRSSQTRRRSSSSSASRSRPRRHRVLTHSRCCRGRRHSPPRRYRARSRSYSPSYSPARSSRQSRAAQSQSTGHGPFESAGRSRSRLAGALDRNTRTCSRSRSRSRPDKTNVHLSLQEKSQLLLVARANAAKTLVVAEVALPACMDTVQEKPTFKERVRPRGPVLSSLKENYRQTELDEEVPVLKLSTKNKIKFSIHNSVARPVPGTPSSSPETNAAVRVNGVTSRNPYGHWVPVNARSFSRSASKRSATKAR